MDKIFTLIRSLFVGLLDEPGPADPISRMSARTGRPSRLPPQGLKAGFSAGSAWRHDKSRLMLEPTGKTMNLRQLIGRLRRRIPVRPRQTNGDWSAGWTPRDWADLPTHPRHDDA